jgi:hypothetical protein
MSGWVKQGAKGPYMNVSFKRRDIQQQGSASPRPKRIDNSDMGGDEIPFAPEFR